MKKIFIILILMLICNLGYSQDMLLKLTWQHDISIDQNKDTKQYNIYKADTTKTNFVLMSVIPRELKQENIIVKMDSSYNLFAITAEDSAGNVSSYGYSVVVFFGNDSIIDTEPPSIPSLMIKKYITKEIENN